MYNRLAGAAEVGDLQGCLGKVVRRPLAVAVRKLKSAS